MKIRICWTLDLSDEERAAIGFALGKELGESAAYEEIHKWYHEQLDRDVASVTAFPLREYYQRKSQYFDAMAGEVVADK